ncbi:hypothetical protein SBRY_40535 [Actinacidiphila bryophytorum]|uniref:Uncharacterized protein n=1 Tax=Actinacidiphila bryophytorum TaxID=1436133 RepID=A0A9W4MIG1_9ACTN|nr:hypothetical protein SBRY_40535 [Actinacidiphila bryophytorum]
MAAQVQHRPPQGLDRLRPEVAAGARDVGRAARTERVTAANV